MVWFTANPRAGIYASHDNCAVNVRCFDTEAQADREAAGVITRREALVVCVFEVDDRWFDPPVGMCWTSEGEAA